MTHRIPGGPSSASGAATTTVGVGAAVGSGVGVSVGTGVAVGSGVAVAVGSGVGVDVGAGVGGGPTRNCVWPEMVRSTRSTFLMTPVKAYCPSRVGTVTT